jgi:hypothetical protein
MERMRLAPSPLVTFEEPVSTRQPQQPSAAQPQQRPWHRSPSEAEAPRSRRQRAEDLLHPQQADPAEQAHRAVHQVDLCMFWSGIVFPRTHPG